MKDLIVEVIGDEIWLKCPTHGLLNFFGGPYANLNELIAAENEHATVHLVEEHKVQPMLKNPKHLS